ncbi:MAG: 4-hydroxythreonine-4-phosphate dehydrogenase PdxA [Bacteroidaceae bacterium]|nr:4-hydroxythreonine-4-phosphate dehydrogenase PdxA [Bacteroidaceae bacterium]
MEDSKIRVSITQGDINGVGFELVLKAFQDPTMLELCTPVIYGSPKVAAFHRKSMDIPTNFSIINSAADTADDTVNLVNCSDEETKVEFAKTDPEAAKAAWNAMQRAIDEYRDGLSDVLVMAPLNEQALKQADINYPGMTDLIQQELGEPGETALSILVKDELRVALATENIPMKEVSGALTKENIKDKITVFNQSLKMDFGIYAPRIAVLSLNPVAGVNDNPGKEEEEIIMPAIKELIDEKVICYGPYSVDYLMETSNYVHFDGIFAMYHDQGMGLFKALGMNEGVKFVTGLSAICASPVHGVEYELAGKGLADESSLRNAIYLCMDVLRNRRLEEEAQANPLRKQYYDKRDDSDKLKQMAEPEEETL